MVLDVKSWIFPLVLGLSRLSQRLIQHSPRKPFKAVESFFRVCGKDRS